jgi:signal transduction histidine kinase
MGNGNAPALNDIPVTEQSADVMEQSAVITHQSTENDNETGNGSSLPPSISMIVPAAPKVLETAPKCTEPLHLKMADEQACYRHEINNEIAKAKISFGLIKKQLARIFAEMSEAVSKVAMGEITEDAFQLTLMWGKVKIDELMFMQDESLKQMAALCEKDRCRRKASTLPPAMAEEAKKVELSMEELNLSDVLDAQVKYWRRVLRQDIEIIKDIDLGIYIMADRVIMTQIFSNIWMNAIQSMQNVPDRPKRMTVSLKVVEGECRLEVHDNGAGIREEHQARLFQPNFTTKKDGCGIGIRLCREKAEEMGGSFDIINGSIFGEGATVKMKFRPSKDKSSKYRELDALRDSTRDSTRQLCLVFDSEKKSE